MCPTGHGRLEGKKPDHAGDDGARYGFFRRGLWLADLKAAASAAGGERQAAALLLAVMFSLFLAGFPAGWMAGGRFEETPLPMWLSMAGGWVAPVAAWFAGLEPAWPSCWPAAFALAFAGSWAGLGLGLLLGRRRREQ
ncbi:hypothetical protein [Neomoorella thermoacetica]|uniref:hypothetical protein n=1 Tax=Neomoorella thermoacetica TaxID=1525 RepID=UPI00003CB1B4|nr:hypothetical protein [Moorella thermoacetica]